MKRLKELRTQRGLTQTQIGELLGVSCVTIARYEAGEREPSNAKLTTLANYFGVTIDYLMGREEPAKEAPTPRDERRAKMEEILRHMPQDKYDQALAILEVLAAEQKKEG